MCYYSYKPLQRIVWRQHNSMYEDNLNSKYHIDTQDKTERWHLRVTDSLFIKDWCVIFKSGIDETSTNL